jgi:Na+/melibiose symporter-like transporter
MKIDVSAAGLLAEVIPALLVFLALEDRLSPANIPRRKWRRRLTRWREATVVANLLALAACLAIVVTRVENSLLSWFIVACVAYLVGVLSLLFAGMFRKEGGRVAREED